VTPYHIDETENFLLQIRGTKVIHICDARDHDLISWPYLEEYYAGNTKVQLPAASRAQAMSFELRPGMAIYNPVNFPHWVLNGPEISVSVSLGYTIKQNPFGVLRVNHRLRKLGFSPAPPGESRVRDAAKLMVFNSLRFTKRLLKGSEGAASANY
jgi:hypothetical protein